MGLVAELKTSSDIITKKPTELFSGCYEEVIYKEGSGCKLLRNEYTFFVWALRISHSCE